VYAPAGLHLGASTPEEIALSVMSQMVALRRGGLVQQIPPVDTSLAGREFDVDAVIRRCEAEILP
jgi:xanthine/CO dehydrogenase XdhC/CoxF family maturation factor